MKYELFFSVFSHPKSTAYTLPNIVYQHISYPENLLHIYSHLHQPQHQMGRVSINPENIINHKPNMEHINVKLTGYTGTTSICELSKIEGRLGFVPFHVRTTIGLALTTSYVSNSKPSDVACWHMNFTHWSGRKVISLHSIWREWPIINHKRTLTVIDIWMNGWYFQVGSEIFHSSCVKFLVL